MIQLKHFSLNGETYITDQYISLFDLLLYFDYNDSLLVLEHNHLICEKINGKQLLSNIWIQSKL